MYDIIFIGEKNKQWKSAKHRFPLLKHANTLDDAKRICITKMFWVVWPDITINDDFNFDYEVDAWSTDYVHVFKNNEFYDGVSLIPKNATISDRELQHRFFVNKKEVDIQVSKPCSYDIFNIDTYKEYINALETSTTDMFWMSTANISIDTEFVNTFYISHHEQIDRKQNHAFIHRVDDEDLYNGVFLCSKHVPLSKREVEYRFPVNRKEHDIVASGPCKYDVFEIDTYEDYLQAIETSTTEMFWMSSPNIDVDTNVVNTFYIPHHIQIDRKQNHAFIHQVDGEDLYNGVFLCSKHLPLSKKEVEYRFPVNRKEHDIVASVAGKYNIFNVDTYEEYINALETSTTEMFYIIPPTVTVCKDFMFDDYFEHSNTFDRRINHVFLNGKFHDGIILCSKYAKISKREWHFKFIANKKEVDIQASTPNPYDIVFISYQEPNADENFENLKTRFPDRVIHRVHGVKGIHQAHIEAAKVCDTPMLYIVDGDAVVVDDFNFDWQVPAWQYNHVHVWRSKNPVNGLVYGYGGIKLFPRHETLNMDISKPDMTTSISDKFVAMPKVSNITAFNTDAFNAWKSAFRECAKLSSKVIDRQKSKETNERLRTWCMYMIPDTPFGEDALQGAKAGTAYGTRNKGDVQALKTINDFDWLKEKFNGNI